MIAAEMKIRLIQWNMLEARARVDKLRGAGFDVDASPFTPQKARIETVHLPSAIVIDLSRRPSQGREVALFLRQMRATRWIPLVFVDGDPLKLAEIRRILPDATYTSWPRVIGATRAALRHPPEDPLVPGVFAAYAGRSLSRKLGIKANSVVALAGAPAGFEHALGQLPDGATVHRSSSAGRTLTLWFARSRRDLQRQMKSMSRHAESAGLWILWPKRTAMPNSDISQVVVRESGLAAGLVDFKICSVNDAWSGLRFTQRAHKGGRVNT